VHTRRKFLNSFWHPLRLRKSLALLLLAAALLIVASSGLLLVNAATNSNSPENKAHIAATARAQKAQATAHVYAAATARVYATSTTIAAATATVAAQYPDPYSPNNNAMLLIYDPLASQATSQWGTGNDPHSGSCQFINGAYHLKEASTQYIYSCSPNIAISNFAFEVHVTILSGDCGGIDFRQVDTGHYYHFQVCQDGTFQLYVATDTNGNGRQLISTTSSAIKRGLKHSNILAVVASGANIDLYANLSKIYSTTDSTYSNGTLALLASMTNNPTDVAYNDAKLWGL
jgi:hypothetical protein